MQTEARWNENEILSQSMSYDKRVGDKRWEIESRVVRVKVKLKLVYVVKVFKVVKTSQNCCLKFYDEY